MLDFDLSKILDLLKSSPLRLNECGQYETLSPLLFSSGLFLFLFIGFYALYRLLLKHDGLRLAWVTLFSLYFYYKCAGHFWLLHVVIVVVDYYLARCIERTVTRKDQVWMSVFLALTGLCLWAIDIPFFSKAALSAGLCLLGGFLMLLGRFPIHKVWLLIFSLVLNLGLLVYFKYNIYSELWCELLSRPFDPCYLFLPAGISFFTFQSLSYTIDVYRGHLKSLDNILDYAFFVTFFPQMLAGPIVRAADFLPQIRKPLFISQADFGRGVFLLCTGLFKKAVISDYISTNFVDRVFDSPEQYTGLENLLGVYGYAMQIYCDFSGYSDMAIGLALLMGFHFPINFDSPYQSLSITEFWRRWHISLSSWLRDYLYIPLGGNRGHSIATWVVTGGFLLITLVLAMYWSLGGAWWWMALWAVAATFVVLLPLWQGRWSVATNFNLFATMLLGGLWHGAASRFIVWGALHGLALAIERWVKQVFPGNSSPLRKAIGGIWTFHFVCFCWIFFRAKGMDMAGIMLYRIAFEFHAEVAGDLLAGYAPVIFWLAIGYLLHLLPKSVEQAAERVVTRLPLAGKAFLLVLIAALVMQVKSSDVQPFIYFQF